METILTTSKISFISYAKKITDIALKDKRLSEKTRNNFAKWYIIENNNIYALQKNKNSIVKICVA